MNIQYIDYAETRCFSSTVTRLIKQDEALKPFINQFPTLKNFEKIIAERQFNGNRNILTEVLKNQYHHIPDQSNLLKSNIDLLKAENTYTITTGHQLNIFTGPLYFIFKIVSAINLAKELKQQFPNKDFVPVYWMATEDHDFEEINHTYIGEKKIVWDINTSGATGRLNPKTIVKALNEYKGILGISENAEKLSQIVTEAYTEHSTLADSTRFLVNKLFGEYGLVILDADDKELKAQFSDIVYQDIVEQNSFKQISASNKQLEKINLSVQVNPRGINFFYLTENSRERIVEEDGLYKVLNTDISFSKDQLKEEIELFPERFSPNVVMRPLYQEVILPNIAYVGGGGEIAYWLQLKSNFDKFKVDFPLLILRNSALIADEKAVNKLKKLGLSFEDVFLGVNELKKSYVQNHTQHQLNLDTEWQQLHEVFENLKNRASLIDPTLKPSTEAVEARLKKAIDSLEKKLIRAEKRNYGEAMSDIEKLTALLLPKGGLQERKENFGLFYIQYGDQFIKELINSFNPLDFKFSILY